MLKTKKFFKRLIAIVLCAIFLDVSSVLSVFAVPSGETIPITNEQIAEALQAAQFIDPSEDSTFVLASSDVQIEDVDYFPETADINELENHTETVNTESGIAPMAAGDPLGRRCAGLHGSKVAESGISQQNRRCAAH